MKTSIIGWIARSLSILTVGLLALFLIGEPTNLRTVSVQTLLLIVFFPLGLIVGLVIGWWRELAGGIVSAGCLVAFCLLNWTFNGRPPNVAPLLIFAVPGALFIIAGIIRPRRAAAGPLT